MGPDCNWAETQALEANDKVWDILRGRPYNLRTLYVTLPSGCERPVGVSKEKVEALKQLLIDIFVEDVCNGF
jgi:hypothetical protein